MIMSVLEKEDNSNKKLNITLFVFILLAMIPSIISVILEQEIKMLIWIWDVLIIAMCFVYVFFFMKIAINKNNLIKIILGLCVMILQYIAYLTNNYVQSLYMILPIIFFIHYLISYCMLASVKIKEIDLSYFFKLFSKFAFIACVYNIIINFSSIINISVLSKYIHISSFFNHRNGFGQFLFFAIIGIVYLILEDKKNKKNYLLLLFFLFNLLFTFSRASILATGIFLFLIFFKSSSKGITKKILWILFLIVVMILGTIFVINNPSMLEFIDYYVIRTDDGLTGRDTLWMFAIDVFENGNYLLGYGLGSTVDLLEKFDFTNTHNTYVEVLVLGGVMYLLAMLALYIYIYIKEKKAEKHLEAKFIVFRMSLISFLVYTFFEKVLLFGTGYAPIITTIFMVTIPLIIINNIKKSENKEESEWIEEVK